MILGIDTNGKPVTDADIKENPFWFRSMASFTKEGRELATTLEELADEIEFQGGEMMAQLEHDKALLGIGEKEGKATRRTGSGEMADLVAADRRVLGLPV